MNHIEAILLIEADDLRGHVKTWTDSLAHTLLATVRDVLGLILVAVCLTLINAKAQAQTLGAADSFSVLGGSTVTNTGFTTLSGDLGVSPGSAITGFPPGLVGGITYTGVASLAGAAQADALIAYNSIMGQPSTSNLTGQDLGGLTLVPGVYTFNSSAQLTGNLFLDTLGDPNAAFYFQIGSTLTTATFSSVSIVGGGLASNIFWQVGSSATLGIGSDFDGNILALTSITMTTGAGITAGRAIALNGAVTMDTNNISSVAAVVPVVPGGNYWKGDISNLWSQMNWSPDSTGAVNKSLDAADANVIFSVTGVAPANQNTILDSSQNIASLTANDSTAVTISGPGTLTISGAGLVTGITINNGAGLMTIASDLVLAGSSQTVTVNNAAGLVISGTVSGGIGLTKAGAGKLTLTGNEIYSGTTNITAGTLQLGDGVSGSLNPASLVTVSAGGTLAIDLVHGGTFSNQVVDDGVVEWVQAGTNTQAATSVIGGTGSMSITAPGTTVILGSNTFSGGTTINTTGVVLSGNPSATTSTAFGTGTLDIQQGTVDTLNGQVIQINVGGYTQSGGEVRVHVQGSAPGSYTQYHVAGAASLTGGTVTLYDQTGLYIPSAGDVQNIIHATGGLTGQFSSSTPFASTYNTEFNQNVDYHQGDTLLYPTVTYDLNNANITWAQDSFRSTPNLTHNQDAVAGGLDGFQNSTPGNAGGALTYLGGQDISVLPALYDLIAPDELTAVFQTGFHAADLQASSIKQHLEQVRRANRSSNAGSNDARSNDARSSSAQSSSAQSSSAQSNDARSSSARSNDARSSSARSSSARSSSARSSSARSSSARSSSARSSSARSNDARSSNDGFADGKNAGSFSPATDPPEHDRWNFFFEGLAGQATVNSTSNASGYEYTSYGAALGIDYLVNDNLVIGGHFSSDTSRTRSGSLDAESYRGAFYATLFDDDFYFDALVGIACNSYETDREALLGRALGSTDGVQFDSLLNAGYDLHSENWSYGPFVSIGYSRVNLNGFTETGSLTPLSFPDQNQDSLRSNLAACRTYPARLRKSGIRPEFPLVFVICVHTNSSNS